MAASAGLAAGMIDAVIERTDGVPLFAEELTRLLLERGEQGSANEIDCNSPAKQKPLPRVRT